MIKVCFPGEVPDGFKGKIVIVFEDELFVESYQFIRNVDGFNSKSHQFDFDMSKEPNYEWPKGGTGHGGDKID